MSLSQNPVTRGQQIKVTTLAETNREVAMSTPPIKAGSADATAAGVIAALPAVVPIAAPIALRYFLGRNKRYRKKNTKPRREEIAPNSKPEIPA